MRSITIHNLDDQLDKLVLEKSKKLGLSLNKTIKYLLRTSLGIKDPLADIKKNNFDDLFGVWKNKDEKEFFKNIKELNKVDDKEWI